MNSTPIPLVIVSGCSGGGKSTLIHEFQQRGYSTVPEPGRILVKEQIAIQGDLTPWQRPIDFCLTLIERGISDYYRMCEPMHTFQNAQPCFFDRCFLDAIAYLQSIHHNDIHRYLNFVQTLRFYPLVFIAPPWEAIYCQDEERKHSLSEAIVEYERLKNFYPKYGYSLLELPKLPIEKRADFVLSHLSKSVKA